MRFTALFPAPPTPTTTIFAEPSDSFILISNKVIFLLTLSTLILYYYSAK